jgi:hypothetical protein
MIRSSAPGMAAAVALAADGWHQRVVAPCSTTVGTQAG